MIAPMLCRNLEVDLDAIIRDSRYALEVKCDGKRVLASGVNDKLNIFNRRGERTSVKAGLRNELETLVTIRGCIDGELVDGILYAFDLPQCGDFVMPGTPWAERTGALETLLSPHFWDAQYVRLLPAALTTAHKRALVKKVWAGGFEGVVAKRIDSRYEFGKRSGSWLKAKNVRTVDAVVMSFGADKANLQFGVYRDGDLVQIGECSRLEGDAPRVNIGDVLEVAMLNAGTPTKPRAYQPHAKHRRDPAEKPASECTFDQLNGLWIQKGLPV